MRKRLDDLIARVRGYARSLRARVLAVLVAVAVASSLWAVSRTHGGWEALALNFGTEMAGAMATYALLEVFLGSRERREAKKAELITQLGSRVHDVAIAAAEELRLQGWLEDGSLQGAVLEWANLQRAFLGGANLQEANLFAANLQGAFLEWADLRGAVLIKTNLQEALLLRTNLQGANLGGADLQGTVLGGADLQGVNLGGANLQGAWLGQANLQGANLGQANLQEANLMLADLQGTVLERASLQGVVLAGAGFDDNTQLPDGTKWTSDTDITRFTDPKHPDFWHPPKSILW